MVESYTDGMSAPMQTMQRLDEALEWGSVNVPLADSWGMSSEAQAAVAEYAAWDPKEDPEAT